jgi:hypothetical protein
MDADLALRTLAGTFMGEDTPMEQVEAALRSLQGVVQTARAYVKGRSVGRFVALCQALQEPTDRPRKAEVSEEEVERFLRERGQMRITTQAARALGLLS